MKALAHLDCYPLPNLRRCAALWPVTVMVFTVLVLFCGPARAEPIIVQPDHLEVINLAPLTQYHLDASADLTIKDIAALPDLFAPVQSKYLDFGLGSFRVWLKISLYNPAQTAQIWRLDLGRQFTQDLDIYLVRTEAPIQRLMHHTHTDPFGTRRINSRTLMTDIKLPPNEVVDIYVGYRSLSTTVMPMTIGRPQSIVAQRASEMGIDAFMSGALIGMIILAALMLPFTGWRLSLSFVFYIIAGMMYVAHADGYTLKYLWPNWSGGNDGFNLALMLLMTACGFNFARVLFNFPKVWPAYNQFMLGFIALAGIFSMLAVPFIRVDWLMRIGYAMMPLGVILQVLTGILAYRRGYLGAGPFIVGAICVLISFIYAVLAHLYPGQFNLDRTLDVGHFALLCEGIAFAGAGVVRLLGLQRERDAAMSAELIAVKDKLAISSTLRETQKQYTAARALLRQRKEQLCAVSHDLQQPLASLRHTITDIAVGNDEAGNQMHHALDYLEQLAKDQVKANAHAPHETQSDGNVEVFPISVIQNNVYEMFKGEAQSKGLALRVRPLDHLVEADAVSLMRVISNLTNNAIRHTEKGGILIGARHRKNHILIEVYDTGPGMTQGEITRLMQRHAKGKNSDGNGLGLAIVHDISARHALNFRFISHVGRGTCARIDVPCHR